MSCGAPGTPGRPPSAHTGLAAPATTILLALTLPLWLESPYFLHVVIMAGIFGVLALSLNLLLGYTGQLSLGHAAFFGIGAYASALLTLRLEWSFWLALPGAVALAALAGWLIGRRLVGCRIGRAFVALRENEALAESVGVNVTHYLVLAAVVSAAMAGLAGSLYAHYTRFVSPGVFLFSYTVTMVIMVVAGGKGTLAGPLVGALMFTVLPEALRAVVSWQWQMLAYGVLLVLLVVFLPRGVVPAITALRNRRASRPSPSS